MPRLDGKLFVRRLNGPERIDFFARLRAAGANKGGDFVAFCVMAGALQADGTRAFDDSDLVYIRDRTPGSFQQRICSAFDRANYVSGLAEDELEKKSAAPQS
jgi:hypothetical protein